MNVFISEKSRIKLVPLLFVLIFSQAKAELPHSAFSGLYDSYQNEDSIQKNISLKKYDIAVKLFKTGNLSRSLELAYGLLDDTNMVVLIKTNSLIGEIFERNKDITTSLKHFQLSLRLLDELLSFQDGYQYLELKKIEAENLIKLGKLSITNNELDRATSYLNRLVGIDTLSEYVMFLKGQAFNNLSVINFNKKDYENAELFAKKAIEIHSRYSNDSELSADYLNLANIYEVTNRREKAVENYFEALAFVEFKTDSKSLQYKEDLYYNIAWSLYNLKDYKAYEYLEKSYDIKDSLTNVNLKKEIKKIERTHNIDLIKKDEEKKRIKLERNNWLIGIVGLMVSLLLLYLANLYKLRQKDLSLQLSINELEQQRRLDKLKSDSRVKILNAAIDGKETERKQIAETLHDNVSALLSSANMHLQASQKQFGGNIPVELQKTQEIILEASEKIRDLSHNLMSSVLLKFGLEYAVKDAAKKYSNSDMKIHTIANNIGRYSQEFEIKIFNIIQELINNVIKHSKASNAYVTLEEENNTLHIIVKDNGIGFASKSSEEYGVGLNQIEARIDVLKGTFEITSSKSTGTKIQMIIPVIRREYINYG